MRSYSFFTIILLCLAILIIDILAFYWLQSILLQLTSSFFKNIIYVAFWVFSIGLITAILFLKIRLDRIYLGRKQLIISSLYGLGILSFVPKLIFVIVISILHFSNYIFSYTDWLIVIPLLAILSGFLPFFVIVYAIFKAVYKFKIHSVTIQFDHLPLNFNGLRIVQISDLHLGSFNFRYKILERAVKMINNLNPDFIFFTGDLVNNYAWELKGWDRIFKQLHAVHGKYAVLGNHDYGDYSQWNRQKDKKANFDSIKYFYKKINFKLLLNKADAVKKGSDTIAIIGVENWSKPPFKKYGNLELALKEVEDIPFKILLSHDPTHWDAEVLQQTNIALTLSGHTHGMQAAINLKNKAWSPIKYKYKRWAGLYKQNQQYLYVNRGLGWLGFPGRMGMRPEITFIKFENG